MSACSLFQKDNWEYYVGNGTTKAEKTIIEAMMKKIKSLSILTNNFDYEITTAFAVCKSDNAPDCSILFVELETTIGKENVTKNDIEVMFLGDPDDYIDEDLAFSVDSSEFISQSLSTFSPFIAPFSKTLVVRHNGMKYSYDISGINPLCGAIDYGDIAINIADKGGIEKREKR